MGSPLLTVQLNNMLVRIFSQRFSSIFGIFCGVSGMTIYIQMESEIIPKSDLWKMRIPVEPHQKVGDVLLLDERSHFIRETRSAGVGQCYELT